MYDLRLLHGLCDRIRRERDPEKLKRLCAVLRTILLEKGAETTLRLKLLQNKCYRMSRGFIPEANRGNLPKMDLGAVRPINVAETPRRTKA
jgi:hypothetical protein